MDASAALRRRSIPALLNSNEPLPETRKLLKIMRPLSRKRVSWQSKAIAKSAPRPGLREGLNFLGPRATQTRSLMSHAANANVARPASSSRSRRLSQSSRTGVDDLEQSPVAKGRRVLEKNPSGPAEPSITRAAQWHRNPYSRYFENAENRVMPNSNSTSLFPLPDGVDADLDRTHYGSDEQSIAHLYAEYGFPPPLD